MDRIQEAYRSGYMRKLAQYGYTPTLQTVNAHPNLNKPAVTNQYAGIPARNTGSTYMPVNGNPRIDYMNRIKTNFPVKTPNNSMHFGFDKRFPAPVTPSAAPKNSYSTAQVAPKSGI